MKSKVFLWPVLALAVTLTAQAQQGKFAVINIQGAIISTKDGQKAAAELNAKTAPKKKELEQKQNEINALQDQLNKGSNTLSDTAKNDLYKNIESKKKSLQREVEDAQADLEADQQKLLQQLGQKILAVIEKYARDNGYHHGGGREFAANAGAVRFAQRRHHQRDHRAVRQEHAQSAAARPRHYVGSASSASPRLLPNRLPPSPPGQ